MKASIYKKKHGKDKNGKQRVSRTWTARIQCDWMPKVKNINLGITDKQLANQRLQELIKEEERAQFGAVPRHIKEAALIPLKEHLQDFIQTIRSLGRTEKHLYRLEYYNQKIMNFCHWEYPQDITLFSFEKWRSQSSLAPKSKNHYLGALLEFCNWMCRHDMLVKNPLSGVRKIDLRGVPKLKRKAYTLSQLNSLLAVLPFKLRCIVLVAVYTGLRRNEIASLTWNDVRLDGNDPVIIAPARITKNREQAVIPLRSELVRALEEYRKTAEGELIFGKFPAFGRLTKYWKMAGIPCSPKNGYDFHSFRVTFATMLGETGAAPRVAQEAMRHSDSRLTETIYTDTANLNIRAAVNALPGIDGALIGALPVVQRGTKLSNIDILPKMVDSKNSGENELKSPDLFNADINKNWRREGDSNPR